MTHPDDTQLRDLLVHLHDHWNALDTGSHVSDEHGRLAFRANHRRVGKLLCTYKDGLHAGQASFMEKPLRVAKAEERTLVQFLTLPPTADTAWAFDPERIANHGRKAQITSPKGIAVTVRQLSASDHGVRLGDYLSGRTRLPGATAREPSEVTLGRWGEAD